MNMSISITHVPMIYDNSICTTEDGDAFNEEHNERMGAGNAIIISIYCIDLDSQSDPNNGIGQKQLIQKLASIHHIIHSKLIPLYNKRYRHHRFCGGEGLSFGMHCRNRNDEQGRGGGGGGVGGTEKGKRKSQAIPHLRAVVHYGPKWT